MSVDDCPTHVVRQHNCGTCIGLKTKKFTDFKCVFCSKKATTRDKDGASVCESHSLPRCLKCNLAMKKRQNRKTKSWFWGCGQYPKCRFTMNIDPKASGAVSKPLEAPMLEKFKVNKWYTIRKSKMDAKSKSASANGGTLNWCHDMNQYDGQTLKVRNFASNDSRVAWFEDCHSYAFHIDWVEGPFDSKLDSVRSRVKVLATREPDIENEIMEFENGLIEFFDRAVVEKVEPNEVHLKDPESGVVSVIQKSEVDKMSPQDKAYKDWLQKRPDVGTVELIERESGDIASRVWTGTEWRIMSSSEGAPIVCEGVGVVGMTGDIIASDGAELAIDAPSTEDFEKLKTMVMGRFEELETQKADLEKRKAYGEKLDTSKKCKKDIDKLFRDFHDRGKRREELTKRLDTELSKGKKTSRNWKSTVILTGCATAIASSAYVLFPYVLAMF